jgi:hypothetical protein
MTSAIPVRGDTTHGKHEALGNSRYSWPALLAMFHTLWHDLIVPAALV